MPCVPGVMISCRREVSHKEKAAVRQRPLLLRRGPLQAGLSPRQLIVCIDVFVGHSAFGGHVAAKVN